ncbi:4-hydroxy-tetrahydrodipicolinate synthase [Paenibacillus psychroresistens]|uniref:4-hydroxy-tetrahydrodipicolinate synthase n=1 Tax=Paenibacillus psychroresistens TaxID=1778678 RepID=A0A6B8RUH6_9BACL|nr:4-hydroxy-tetrahydrodipicolinate synthase [Paenibacillus psychroresistens]QGQ99472.1 4-hydroxy-tetrahydrodipicolinate synthase [Paenibacillus psychroresistens]
MLKPSGIIPAMVTPFTDKDELNEPVVRQMVNYFIESGVHGIFCLGTNGEFFSMNEAEKLLLVQIAVEESGGRVPIYAGAGGITTREAATLAAKFEQVGADALSIITPYFVPVSQQEMVQHYKSIAASTSLPILLYNIPARTGVSLAPQTVEALSKVPNIVGIKDSSGNFDAILEYIERTDPDFAVMAGTDSLILATLMAGGSGAVAATANIVPKLVVSIYEHWLKGELELAKQAQMKLRPIRNASQLGTLPSAFKAAMNMLGIPVGSTRLPVGAISDNAKEELKQILQLYSAGEGLHL